MPSYQPKISTKYKRYPCRICKKIKDDKDMLIDVDENNAPITKQYIKRPICIDCYNAS